MTKTCIIISGPTAIGKTALAIELAQKFSTEIISADSRQCYKELNIGVAKPTHPELELVKHHFINSHSIQENINVVDFEKYALDSIAKIFEVSKIAIMVGGTGLYLKAFTEGIDNIPAIPAQVRTEISNSYSLHGFKWLEEKLMNTDVEYANRGDMKNPQRMLRALEVKLHTTKSILTYQSGAKKQRDFNIIKIGLESNRETLYTRINSRVDNMISQGLIEEAFELKQFELLNALQTVGYAELFEYFKGNYSKEQAIDLIKQHTRHYAKRQMTWFKKDTSIQWFSNDAAEVFNFLSKKLD